MDEFEFDSKPGGGAEHFDEVSCASLHTPPAPTTTTATTMPGALVKQGSVAGAAALAIPHAADAEAKPAPPPQLAQPQLAPSTAHLPMHSPPDSQRQGDGEDWAGYCSESGLDVDESFELTCAEFVAPDMRGLAGSTTLSSSFAPAASVAAAVAQPSMPVKDESSAVTAGKVGAATPAHPAPAAAPRTPPSARSRTLATAAQTPSPKSPLGRLTPTG